MRNDFEREFAALVRTLKKEKEEPLEYFREKCKLYSNQNHLLSNFKSSPPPIHFLYSLRPSNSTTTPHNHSSITSL